MKNILLVTIRDYNNLGNRLQNYALQTVLENLGCSVDNLDIHPIPERDTVTKVKNLVKMVLSIAGIRKFTAWRSEYKRWKKCISFTQKYIHNLVVVDRSCFQSFNFEGYDYAVTGSDQVWHNWNRIPEELSYFYLDFMPGEKRISYAPSFGFTSFPECDIKNHIEGLMGMTALSCREQEGCDLIRQLTGREAQKVLDPTLLLSSDDWEKIEVRPDFRIRGPYLLQFFLGKMSEAYEKEVRRLAEGKNLQVLNVNDPTNPRLRGISPEEFIWLIHHADVVCTDSFHASVFSIHFERNLRVFERISPQYGNMFGRLRDLLEPLGLIENVYGRGQKLNTVLTEENKAYLSREREKSVQYLRKSLGIEDA